MESVSIQYDLEVLKTAAVTDTIRNGSTTIHKGVSESGNAFVAVDERSSKIVVITMLSSGSAVLIDAI